MCKLRRSHPPTPESFFSAGVGVGEDWSHSPCFSTPHIPKGRAPSPRGQLLQRTGGQRRIDPQDAATRRGASGAQLLWRVCQICTGLKKFEAVFFVKLRTKFGIIWDNLENLGLLQFLRIVQYLTY